MILRTSNWLKRHAKDPFVKQSKTDKYRSRAAYKLKSINDKHLLMVHPGESDENLQKIDSVTSTRNLERDFLKSDDFLNILEENSVELRPLHTIIS